MHKSLKILVSVCALSAFLLGTSTRADGEINVYSFRQKFLVEPLFQAFEKETGIMVNVVFAKKGLIERLRREGKNSPADLLLTSNFTKLNQALSYDLAEEIVTDKLQQNIPENFRRADGKWYALTTRARVIYASKERVKPGEITTYEDLADPKWAGRICTRSGSHSYNLGLIASMIVHHGSEDAGKWLEGVKANLARKPQGNDRAQVKAIWQGECDLAIGNSYYMGKMLNNEEQKAWADSVNIIFPNQADRGTHMNISGIMLTKNAPNKDNAVRLMEFLSSDKAQSIYSEVNYEYPVKKDISPSKLVKSWGKFKADTIELEKIAGFVADASRLVDKVGYNQ